MTAGLAAAVLWPLTHQDRDSFPLSTYPMFSKSRPRVLGVDTAVALVGDREVRLDPTRIAGTDEVILAAATVSKAIGAGPDAAQALCAEIASRVADGGPDGASEVVVRDEQWDTVAYFDGGEPESVVEHARCPVRAR